ncbi:uncharacterized protein LOC123202766 [Mangifera indica]|uniref:uncharacterized protein LOC123202766 n=1 Tax=Mangifera indica TaxID=29780 RepID=UPI001CFB3DB6|nr:uncharacterized protein LOC123202766 [Mangifera indica]XP_044474819.1 uncharacterized protein LOC123202766 [Mangifera indica]
MAERQTFAINYQEGAYRFHDAYRFRVHMSLRTKMDIMTIIRNKLTFTQRAIFRTTCFGHLLDFTEPRFSAIFIQAMLFRMINRGNPDKEIWFRINGVEFRFSPVEFALVTGLIFGEDMDVSNYVNCTETPRLREEYFPNIHRLLSHGEIEQAFNNEIWGDNDDDAVKFAVLYYAFTGLLGADNRTKIPDHFLHLVDNLDAFSRYPWGTLTWNKTVDSMRKGIHNKYQYCVEHYPPYTSPLPLLSYSILGYPIAFQYWIYETIQNLSPYIRLEVNDRIPRILKWKTIVLPTWDDILILWDAPPEGITTTLHPTETERYSEWYIRALEFMGEDTPSTSSDDESIDSDNDDDIQSNHSIPFQIAPRGSSQSSTASLRISLSRGARPVIPLTSHIRQTSPSHVSSSRTGHPRESHRAFDNVRVFPPQMFTSRGSHPQEHQMDELVRHSIHGTSYSDVSYDRLQQILTEHGRGISSQIQQQLDQHAVMMRTEWERQLSMFREEMQSHWQQQTSIFHKEIQDQRQQQTSILRGEMQELQTSLNNRIARLEDSYVQASRSIPLDDLSDNNVRQQVQDQPITIQKLTRTKKV